MKLAPDIFAFLFFQKAEELLKRGERFKQYFVPSRLGRWIGLEEDGEHPRQWTRDKTVLFWESMVFFPWNLRVFFVKNGGNFGRENELNILEAQMFFMKIRSCK